MKKIATTILIATALFSNTSCSKFLEESSKDMIRPVTATHYKELLQGEGYFKDMYKHGWFVDLMTDDINVLQYNLPVQLESSKLKESTLAYKWAPNIEHDEGTIRDNLFKHLYKNALAANIVLEMVPSLEEDDGNKDVVIGQAYFHRAYAYFVLANLYAQAYNEAKPTDLCVPLVLSSEPSLTKHPRATMEEVWGQIRSDIKLAVEYLRKDKMTRGTHEVNLKAALLLASRIFLYTEQYAEVQQYGEEFLTHNDKLQNITHVENSPTLNNQTQAVFLRGTSNPEVVFTFGRARNSREVGTYLHYTRDNTLMSLGTYSVSQLVPRALLDTYADNDKRKIYWFIQPDAPSLISSHAYSPAKVFNVNEHQTTQFMRSAEFYLNLAEAYALGQSPNLAKAAELLNSLRNNRIANNKNIQAADFSSADKFKAFIYEERRRELCFEEFHRWWDLRRTGQPMLEHAYLGEKYRLAEKDPAYILNFPEFERDFNSNLVENFRPERQPTN